MHNVHSRKHSLYTTLGIIIIATVTSVMSVNLVINYIQISDRLTEELKDDVHYDAVSLAKNIAPFIEAYAPNEYLNLVKNEIQQKDLLAIIVSDRNMAQITGKKHFKSGFIQIEPGHFSEFELNQPQQEKLLKDSYFHDQHNIFSSTNELIGTVTLYASDQTIHTALDELLFSSLMNMLAITLILTLLLFLAIQRFFLSPLSKAISVIEKTDDAGIPTQEINAGGPKEIAELSQTINTMVRTIRTAKEALSESEFRWKFAVDGRGDGLWDWDLTNNSFYYSPQCKVLLGLSSDDNLDTFEGWKARIPTKDIPIVMAEVEKHLKGETPFFNSEHRIYAGNGQTLWVQNRGIVVERSETGSPLRMIGTISDISGRVQAQDELKNALRINKLIIETIPDLLWLKDADGHYLLCNSQFEKFFGAKAEVIMGQTDYDFVDHELADFFREHDRIAMEAGHPSSNEEWITFAEGGYHGLFEATKTPLIDEDNNVIGVLGISHDITDYDQLIHNLTETKQLLLSLVNAIPFFIYRIDLAGRLTFVNTEFSRYFNQSPEALVGQNLYQIFPSHWVEKSQQQDQQVIQTQSHLHETEAFTNLKASDKSDLLYFEIIKLPIYDFDQKLIGVQGIFWNVTESILSKKALEHSAKHDPLTGLPNRYLFNELIQTAMHRCDRNKQLMALLYLDLDGFKEVNDTLGHEAGDEVLINVSTPMKAVLLRKEDIVARLGGDEFVIAIADLDDKKELLPILDRLLSDLHQTLSSSQDGEQKILDVTVSIGVTFYPQQQTVDAEDLLHQADKAMYQAKTSGKNKYHFYDDLSEAAQTADS